MRKANESTSHDGSNGDDDGYSERSIENRFEIDGVRVTKQHRYHMTEIEIDCTNIQNERQMKS